jgi:hypothetical protein
MPSDDAQTIALKALTFVLADDDARRRFVGQTGLDGESLRAQAGEDAFLGGVLDFLLADEALLLRFCEASDLTPEAPCRARAALPGATPEW